VTWALNLEATSDVTSGVEDVIIASASVGTLRRMAAADRAELARSQLTTREHDRYAALEPFTKRQHEWLAGRIAAKRSVAELTGARPHDIEILQDDHASPPYVSIPGIHIGISHSFEVALGAAAPHAIGVDIELVRPLPTELIEYAFVAGELEPLGSDAVAMVQLWTMKESFVKMLGLGIAAFDDLRLVSYDRGRSSWFTRGRVAAALGSRQARCWAALASGYAIALTWSVMR
jgi:4'-phosphopantetheinyl transferase